ncbi:MAG: cyclase family protein [Spirochaetia bacterium]|nr:cyclase family protein [Spirochaetia bacterium]
MKFVYLNHTLNRYTPLYGNSSGINIIKVRQILQGDTSNNTEVSMPLHSGTHVDASYHFDNEGKKISDYVADFWVFNHVYFIEINVEPSEIILMARLEKEFEKIPYESDFLIVKTGFEKYRNNVTTAKSNLDVYIMNNPGFAPEVGIWLRQNRKIRAIGFDFISLTSYQNRDLGRVAHRAFLSSLPDGFTKFVGDPVLIVEDMKLSEISKAPEQVIIAPLLVENADGAPVTIFAKMSST